MPSATNYTIQADVCGEQKHTDMPDIGVVANRYTLMLDGNKQRLRLHSWDAVPRIEKSNSFAWKPDVWYRLKLTVEVQGNRGIIRGKAWQRDQPEPSDWMIELDDPSPNHEGSAAVYGYATGIVEDQPGAEGYFDNVVITPNTSTRQKID
jgi:hypothetical protein